MFTILIVGSEGTKLTQHFIDQVDNVSNKIKNRIDNDIRLVTPKITKHVAFDNLSLPRNNGNLNNNDKNNGNLCNNNNNTDNNSNMNQNSLKKNKMKDTSVSIGSGDQSFDALPQSPHPQQSQQHSNPNTSDFNQSESDIETPKFQKLRLSSINQIVTVLLSHNIDITCLCKDVSQEYYALKSNSNEKTDTVDTLPKHLKIKIAELFDTLLGPILSYKNDLMVFQAPTVAIRLEKIAQQILSTQQLEVVVKTPPYGNYVPCSISSYKKWRKLEGDNPVACRNDLFVGYKNIPKNAACIENIKVIGDIVGDGSKIKENGYWNSLLFDAIPLLVNYSSLGDLNCPLLVWKQTPDGSLTYDIGCIELQPNLKDDFIEDEICHCFLHDNHYDHFMTSKQL